MATKTITEQRAPDDRSEHALDKTVEDTFPASDPPSTGGATRIEQVQNGDAAETDPDDEPLGEDLADEGATEAPGTDDVPPDDATKSHKKIRSSAASVLSAQ